MFFTGGTVAIDHGHGVTSIYSHLASIAVPVGKQVDVGEMIGTVGSTGRSTGPHLDWRINWFDLRLDPELIAGPMPVRGN
jgi:murein DD-endopeptidase MepM/ murein hydrolase activator NlpD